MLRLLMIAGFAVAALFTLAEGRVLADSLEFTDGTPAGIGNPPVAGLVDVKVKWSNVAGANKVVFDFYRVTRNGDARVLTLVHSAGNTPIQATGTASQTNTGQIASGQTGCVIVTIQDANGNTLQTIQSTDFVVP
jgi:hypothetical protein